MNRVIVLIALVLLVAGVALFPHIWNPVENGPDLRDSTPFIGCYASGANRLVLAPQSATVVATHQRTQIVRFFYLKTEAAINTVNNLEYDAAGKSLRVGTAQTGFFYRFDTPTKPSAILIPDDGGNVRTLLRVPC